MSSETYAVLLVEDNPGDARLVSEMIHEESGIAPRLDHVETLEGALRRMGKEPYDAVLIDLGLPDSQGLDTFHRLNEHFPGTPILILTGNIDQEVAVAAVKAGAQDYLIKGEVQARPLVRAVRYAIERQRLEEELRRNEEALRNANEKLRDQMRHREEAEDEVRRLNAELEERVRVRTRQLEGAVKEMEAFSYSISHDLRTPLRAIDGFSRIVLERQGENLDPQTSDYLNRIRKAAIRMAELIDDLLTLSRIGRHSVRRTSVNMSAVANEILGELSAASPERTVETIVEDDLTVEADPVLVRVILQNLLDNAWKFTSRTPDARIEFGRTDSDPREFFVKDNGAGFDPARAEQIWAPFHRLHRQDEFEGSGVGLAIVQRVISRQGGTIRAEGEVGRGAVFFFTTGDGTEEL